MVASFLQEDDNDIPFTGVIASFDVLKAWATDKCIPFVREITFENAEVSITVHLTYHVELKCILSYYPYL